MKAQVIQIYKYKKDKPGGKPCGGRLYSLFHDGSSKNSSNPVAPVFVPQGYKYCSKRGLVRIENEPIKDNKEEKEEKESNIEGLAAEQKTQKQKEKEPEHREKTELSRIVTNNYKTMQREEMDKTNNYRKMIDYLQSLREGKKRSTGNNDHLCPLCGSKVNHKSHEEDYSNAA